MNRRYLIPGVFLAIFFVGCLLGNGLQASGPENSPLIHIDPIRHSFPTVYEGEELSHTFTVQNKGTADLEIKKVTHS